MRVGIVGGGISGLAAAYTLRKEGVESVLFEAEDRLGGRLESAKFFDSVVDLGAQTLTPRGLAMESALQEADGRGELYRIPKPLYLFDQGRAMPGSPERNAQPRYTFRSGIQSFAESLAQAADVRLGVKVDKVVKRADGFEVAGEVFDVVILTPPLPLTRTILAASGVPRNLGAFSYRPCLSVALGYDRVLPPPPYYALLSANRMSPLIWATIVNELCPGRVPEGKTVFVAQMGPEHSRTHFGAEEERVAHGAASCLARVIGAEWSRPDAYLVRRWLYSQPERVSLFDSLNPPESRVIIAGDGTLAGRAENAYETGVRAAARAAALAAEA
ncbi:MAG: NAD(P)-binding protein [Armatimonadetes bacterium]|nr:FAD-binding protein [Armatimonadota bacterium]NOG92796.1 NAD(P)-binding protein [Armatimonadota bacterium]